MLLRSIPIILILLSDRRLYYRLAKRNYRDLLLITKSALVALLNLKINSNIIGILLTY